MTAQQTNQEKGYSFEREVASLYRALGAQVELDRGLAGNQIDLLVTERTPAGSDIKVAVSWMDGRETVPR